ncbi:tyrosine-type recombinase/integrase [Bradyrhizobium sp. 190]|uniref:tyrosine-type recombinase/integrase n=1 Tax=Bradyrhizobium sp. 190 TaxID=2782658 RepID=UPI001FF743E1|nr:tyrosine-type recombinase/integrase [Bradyrhizobium sp. 190]MCK1516116.1 tyrosine-type recombinase/integrase [Bradyrhizobium sp. 190]
MIKTRLKYCIFDPDPNGNDRYYVRKPGHRKIRIKETFQDSDGRISPAFMKVYFEALEALDGKRDAPKTPREKTFYWLVDQYYRSPKFKSFDQLTQADKRGVLDRFCQTAGDLPYAALRKEDVEASQDKRRATPAAADKLVKYLRSLFVWAIEKKLATFNPAVGIAKINETEGWHTWTPAEVDIYRQHHKIGTKARLALELMLNVGARISDASRIGRQHETDGWLNFVAWKNRNRNSRKRIQCPITRELAEALAASPTGDLTYLVNDLGRPFTINGLGNKMRDWCDAAGLHQCTAHGLRKAAAVTLAESGVTAPELCALFGWSKLETAEIYIRQARQRTMVANAFTRLEEYRNQKSVSVLGSRTTNETKRKNNRDKSKPK